MELMELADGYITTYRNHGPGKSEKVLGTIAPEFCTRRHSFRPWYFPFEFWNVIDWKKVYASLPGSMKSQILEAGIVK